MSKTSAAILDRIRLAHGKDIDLTLRNAYADLLARLNHPEYDLPCPIVVAGTNGKGSTCAFMRAMLEAAGLKVHVFTSPHLVRFHERIRIAGQLIEEDELVSILSEIERTADPGSISIFEAGTAAALLAFSRHPADVTILEVGLGGRLDATNVIPRPATTVIARLSYDHREYLGNTMTEIAREKAGILRPDIPCVTSPQPSAEALQSLRDEATAKGAPLIVGGEDWRIEAVDADHFRYLGPTRKIEMMPRPALVGTHQLWNAGLAITTLETLPFSLPDAAICAGLLTVDWAGRLQHLTQGKLLDLLPPGSALWLDGGHNDSAGEVLAAQMRRWHSETGKPIDLVYGMLSTKTPEEFLGPMLPFLGRVRTLTVQGEVPGFEAEDLATHVRALGLKDVSACASLTEALSQLAGAESAQAPHVLVCGSLYLVGRALRENET